MSIITSPPVKGTHTKVPEGTATATCDKSSDFSSGGGGGAGQRARSQRGIAGGTCRGIELNSGIGYLDIYGSF